MEDQSSISTPSSERPLKDYEQIFATPERGSPVSSRLTASPPDFSTIVLKTVHNAGFDLNVLVQILPIVKISPEEIKEKGGDFDEIFISVRNYPKHRGYRGPSNIKSFLDLDFFFMDRNFHLKISKEKISIVGGGSIKLSRMLIETLYHHFKVYHETWIEFGELSTEKRIEVCRYYEDHLKRDDLDLPFEDDPLAVKFYKFLDVIIDRNNEDVRERLCDIMPIIGRPLYKNPPVFDHEHGLVNCNALYNYHLPEEICLVEKANMLKRKGYEVLLHNSVIIKCMKASYKGFRFSILNVGTVKQTSCGNEEESIAMYRKLVTDLGYLPYQDGLPYAIKPKSRTIEFSKKTPACIAILDRYFS